MQAYKFRILHDESEEFFRDIEILSDQTFEDFRQIIHRSTELPAMELSSFYQCSASWEKLREITLMDMSEEENPIETMDKALISAYVESPQQRFIYEYDFLNPITFFIQLVAMIEASSKKNFPRLADGEGVLKFKDSGELSAGIDYKMIDEFDELLRGDVIEPESDYYPDFEN